MANIFGIATAALVVLSLWIGYRNNAEFDKQQDRTEQAEKKFNNAQDEQKEISAKIKEAEESIKSFKQELAENVNVPEELELAIVELETQQANLEKKVKRDQKAIVSIEQAREEFPDPDVVIPRVTEMKTKIAQLKVDLAGEQDSLDTLGEEVSQVAARAETFKTRAEMRTSGKSFPTLATTVKGVYRNWGFVTLNGGNAQGVVPGSTLDVVRDGAVVAKLKVTAVEQNRASADILPDALPEVVALRAGDKVVAAK